MSTPANGRGYATVQLFRAGIQKTCNVNRLVASAFLGMPPDPETQCHHKNFIRHDNRIENLAWVSGKYNMQNREIATLRNCYILSI